MIYSEQVSVVALGLTVSFLLILVAILAFIKIGVDALRAELAEKRTREEALKQLKELKGNNEK